MVLVRVVTPRLPDVLHSVWVFRALTRCAQNEFVPALQFGVGQKAFAGREVCAMLKKFNVSLSDCCFLAHNFLLKSK